MSLAPHSGVVQPSASRRAKYTDQRRERSANLRLEPTTPENGGAEQLNRVIRHALTPRPGQLRNHVDPPDGRGDLVGELAPTFGDIRVLEPVHQLTMPCQSQRGLEQFHRPRLGA